MSRVARAPLAGRHPAAGARHLPVSFLDPYERNRRLSLLSWLRLLVWSAIALVIGLLVWWLAG